MTGKVRLPSVDSLTGGTTRRLEPAECNACRLVFYPYDDFKMVFLHVHVEVLFVFVFCVVVIFRKHR